MFRDAMTLSLVNHFNPDTQSYQPAVVFLNGEYWGIHNLRERIDPYFFASRHALDPQKIEIFESQTEIFQYAELLVYLENHNLTDPKNYDFIHTQIDVDDFINYFISEIYSRNTDWPQKDRKSVV